MKRARVQVGTGSKAPHGKHWPSDHPSGLRNSVTLRSRSISSGGVRVGLSGVGGSFFGLSSICTSFGNSQACLFKANLSDSAKPPAPQAPGVHRPDAQTPEDSGITIAPKRLNDQMAAILRFKTATFTDFGLQRNGVWGTETAAKRSSIPGCGSALSSPRPKVRFRGAALIQSC